MMKLKNWTLIVLTVLSFSACSALKPVSERTVKINVKNPTTLDRENEMVEVDWTRIQKKLSLDKSEDFVVLDNKGGQVPYQLLFDQGEEPSTLIFLSSFAEKEKKTFVVKRGAPEEFEPLVFGRLVPERRDDFTWENNRVAYRLYGPALQATGEISNGLDIWTKRTDKLIIDKWYEADLAGRASYHQDHGEGLDYYKVGPTLGLGMTSPLYEGELCLGQNFVTAEILEDGPLRVKYKFSYAPYKVGDYEVIETRYMTLDAYDQLNKVEKFFVSDLEELDLATGFVLSGRDEQVTFADHEEGILAYRVLPSEHDGTIFTGSINLSGYSGSELKSGHYLGYNKYETGTPYVYYAGGGWTKYGFETFDSWVEYLKKRRIIIANPLIIKIK